VCKPDEAGRAPVVLPRIGVLLCAVRRGMRMRSIEREIGPI